MIWLKINAGLRRRAPRVLEHTVLDEQITGADDADALAVIVVADHVPDDHVGARHALARHAEVDAVAAAVGQRQAGDAHARATVEIEHVPPLGVFVLRLVVVVLFPHPQHCAVAGQRDVRLRRRREKRIARSLERAAFGLHDGALLENDLLVAGEMELVRDPRRAGVLDNKLARAGIDGGLQRRSRVGGIKSPPRGAGFLAFARTDFLNGGGIGVRRRGGAHSREARKCQNEDGEMFHIHAISQPFRYEPLKTTSAAGTPRAFICAASQ